MLSTYSRRVLLRASSLARQERFLSNTKSYVGVVQDFAHDTGLHVGQVPLEQVSECGELLYDIYYRELGWLPTSPNPSNLRCENGRFIDDFEEKAVYFGARCLDTGRLVGVSRCMSNQDCRLEYSLYDTNLYIPNDVVVCEINRHAVAKEWRQTGAISFLVCNMILYATAEWNAQLVVGAVDEKDVVTLANRFHGIVLENKTVLYETNDKPRHFVAFSDSLAYRKKLLETMTMTIGKTDNTYSHVMKERVHGILGLRLGVDSSDNAEQDD